MLNWLANMHGASHAWKVENLDDLDDDGFPRQFVLKHFREGALRPRVIEYVAGRLISELLPYAPGIQILHLTPEFLQAHSELHGSPYSQSVPSFITSAVAGPHMAVEWVNGDDLGGNNDLLDRLAVPTQIPDIVGCDGMLQNVDRDGWNILIRPVAKTNPRKFELIPFDWDNCFFNSEMGSGQLNAIGGVWKLFRMEALRERIHGKEQFYHLVERLSDWAGARARVQALLLMPPEWGVPDGWRVELREHILKRIDVTLEQLQKDDEPGAAFPNWQISAL